MIRSFLRSQSFVRSYFAGPASGAYFDEYDASLRNPEEFWMNKASQIPWFTPPSREDVLTKDEHGLYRWFKGAKLNTSYLAVDRHVENGRGEQVAIYYDSPVTRTKSQMTYRELLDYVNKTAGILKDMGVNKGDAVVIYMPMIPQAIVAMLACARIGAVHSVVFGGFSAAELSSRLMDSRAKAVIAGSCGIEPSRVVNYKPMLDEALKLANMEHIPCLIKQREQSPCDLVGHRDWDWDENLNKGTTSVAPVHLDATDPLYILYTSGTTGVPKGIVRDNGGHAVALNYAMDALMGVQAGEVYWAASDVGWIVGHTFIVYAPLMKGCSTVIFEGKPVGTPDPGTFWRVAEEYKCSALFTAPTAYRAIRKEDPKGEFRLEYPLKNLRGTFLAGERLDPPTYEWLKRTLPEHTKIVDNWWQTETGWPITCNPVGIETFEAKAGSSTFPVPGFDLKVLDTDGNEVERGETGAIAIKLPLPPCCFPTIWQNPQRMKDAYLSTYEGYYSAEDAGMVDEDGYVFIMGRTDDVINVAGHRLSTGQMEEIVGGYEAVAECAVIGVDDALKGELPVAFVITKAGITMSDSEVQKGVVQRMRDELGAVGALKTVLVVQRLPKTRSGKILRKLMRQLSAEKLENAKVPSTIEDMSCVEEIYNAMKEAKVGQFSS